MPLHILHVFPQFAFGGAQLRSVILMAELGARYHHTIVSIGGNYAAAEMIPSSVKHTLFGALDNSGSLGARLLRYRRVIEVSAPDVLATYNWGAIEWAIANLGGVGHAHHEDGFGPQEAERQISRRVWTRRLVLSGSQVVAPSRTLADIATRVWRLNPKHVRHIPNGMAAQDKFDSSIEDLGLNLPPDLPRVVWVGGLRVEKNLPRMLRAFAPHREKAVLLIIGDGTERAPTEAEIERLGLAGKVHLLGQRTDARDLVMQCDVLALSSDTEQMPLVVMEAMDAGLTVVSTDVGDVADMVCEENRPFITPLTDSALSEALGRVLSDAPLRERIGQANRTRQRDTYALHRMVRSYDELFSGLAHKTE